MATVEDGGAAWRAAALDVRGPGSRRGGRWQSAGPDEAFATGDRGELWIEGDALYFSGRQEAWSVPLNWLGLPEAGLAGVIEIALRTADSHHSLTLRLEDAGGERPLAAAIQHSRVQTPDARDRRALTDLIALLQPELNRLESAATTLASDDREQRNQHAAHLLAAVTRLRSTWLPYWGDPATRLRDAALGALMGAGEATRPEAGAAAIDRYEEASRRFRNVCEDLHDWCRLPESLDTLPPPRRPALMSETPVAASSAATFAENSGQQSIAGQPAAEAAIQHSDPPVTGLAEPALSDGSPSMPMPPAPAEFSAPAAVMSEAEEDVTVIAPARGQYQASPGASPAGAISPGTGAREPHAEDDPTLIVSTPVLRDPPSASPATGYAASSDPLSQTPAIAGPGRPGSGGMTMLYRRSGFGSDGQVARKVLQQTAMDTPDAAATFQRIGERFASVQHPNFVRIVESGANDDGLPYIDMEFVEGESSHARLRRGPLPLDQALDVIDQLAGAVDAVHRAGLVHGDVRPMNVLFEPGGRAVLLEPSVASDYLLEQRRGTIYGELSYLTPERVRGEPLEAMGDIYALGSLAFALLTGHPPFGGEAADIFTGHAEGTPPLLESMITAPHAASEAIARSLSKRPSDRQPTAAELASTLRRAFAEASDQPAAPSSASIARAPAEESSLPGAPPAGGAGAGNVRPANRSAPVPPGYSAPGPLGRSLPGPLGPVTLPPRNTPEDPN